jgi:hypothetical protein
MDMKTKYFTRPGINKTINCYAKLLQFVMAFNSPDMVGPVSVKGATFTGLSPLRCHPFGINNPERVVNHLPEEDRLHSI